MEAFPHWEKMDPDINNMESPEEEVDPGIDNVGIKLGEKHDN